MRPKNGQPEPFNGTLILEVKQRCSVLLYKAVGVKEGWYGGNHVSRGAPASASQESALKADFYFIVSLTSAQSGSQHSDNFWLFSIKIFW